MKPMASDMIVTAHRGASGSAPENTIAALKKAIEEKADFAEIDVQATKDGKIILFHDDNLERTTNRTGLVATQNWDDLKDLDAGTWFDPKFADQKIPLLSDAIDAVQGKLRLNIEIKTSSHYRSLVRNVVDIIQKKLFIKECIITSFHHPTIEYVQRLDPEVKTGFIFFHLPESKNDQFTGKNEIISCYWETIDQTWVQQAHLHQKQVHVWTVNEESEMRRMITCGVDSIITNYPQRLRQLLEKERHLRGNISLTDSVS